MTPVTTGRLVLLATTHRSTPGALTWPAWSVLRAGRVLAGDSTHPLLPYLAEAGVQVELLPDRDAQRIAHALMDAAAAAPLDIPVVWVSRVDGDPALGPALAAAVTSAASGGRNVPEIEVLHGSHDLPGTRLLDLVALMDRLRSPGGCPWDAEQTHDSLLPYLLEETYEVAEAVETGDLSLLREELGDLLLQVVFHARLATEYAVDPWSIDDVAAGIVDKLVRRHPHVFGTTTVAGAAEVKANWEQLKVAEKGRRSVTDGVPLGQPALASAAALLGRGQRAGLIGPLSETRPGIPNVTDPDQLGDHLLAVVSRSVELGIDPEVALRTAVRRLRDELRAAESLPTVANGGHAR
ncbi:nucleoside triphosphate pyrophosphohydrolase [soil metagenome]